MTISELDILAIKYSRIIEDPFPLHSEYARDMETLGRAEKYFGNLFSDGLVRPPDVSIWAAYKMGYDKAYEEVIAGFVGRSF